MLSYAIGLCDWFKPTHKVKLPLGDPISVCSCLAKIAQQVYYIIYIELFPTTTNLTIIL